MIIYHEPCHATSMPINYTSENTVLSQQCIAYTSNDIRTFESAFILAIYAVKYVRISRSFTQQLLTVQPTRADKELPNIQCTYQIRANWFMCMCVADLHANTEAFYYFSFFFFQIRTSIVGTFKVVVSNKHEAQTRYRALVEKLKEFKRKYMNTVVACMLPTEKHVVCIARDSIFFHRNAGQSAIQLLQLQVAQSKVSQP